jgi:NTP pyrophosphatase (non-canonical NTP hydrolase)
MQLNEYQETTRLTDRTNKPFGFIAGNYMAGLAGEVGELLSPIKKVVYHEHPLDSDKLDKIKDEAGDVLCYLTKLISIFGFTLEEVAQYNIEKLQKRYPNGFDVQRSINREEK